MHECKNELRIANMDKEIAVVGERNKALAKHVEEINDGVNQLKRWVMTFIISMALLVSGSIVKDHIGSAKANAADNKEIKNGK